MRVDRPLFGVLFVAVAALLPASCAAPSIAPPGKLSPSRPADSVSLTLAEPGIGAAQEVQVPSIAAAAAEVQVPSIAAAVPVEVEIVPAPAAPAAETTDVTAPAPAAPTGLPYVAEVERWRPYVRMLLDEARAEGRLRGAASVVNEDLVLAVIEQESGGDPEAESEAGALGLMQLMPETFAYFMGLHDWGDDVSDVARSAMVDVPTNLRAGIRCLAGVLDEQGGSIYWALASYNAGGGTVNRWRAAGFSAVPDWQAETANYPQAILSNFADHHVRA